MRIETHTFINTDQSEVREKVRDEPITENRAVLTTSEDQSSKLPLFGDHEDGGHTTCLGQSEASTQANQRASTPSSGSSDK